MSVLYQEKRYESTKKFSEQPKRSIAVEIINGLFFFVQWGAFDHNPTVIWLSKAMGTDVGR
jgi:hypothetical protein